MTQDKVLEAEFKAMVADFATKHGLLVRSSFVVYDHIFYKLQEKRGQAVPKYKGELK